MYGGGRKSTEDEETECQPPRRRPKGGVRVLHYTASNLGGQRRVKNNGSSWLSDGMIPQLGKSAAVKARRRQWDPPEKPKHSVRRNTPELPCTLPPTSPTGEPVFDHARDPDANVDVASPISNQNAEVVSLTSAERFALGVLAEMAEARTSLTKRIEVSSESAADFDHPMVPDSDSDGVDSILEKAIQLSLPSVLSPSLHSSVTAVNDAPITQPRGNSCCYTTEKLPPYISPATRLQKKHQREVGLMGPLTGVQQAQIAVVDLARSLSENDVNDEPTTADASPTVRGPFLSSERR
ncbi:hypothetical protein B0H19DRAFT_1080879 [Mycena capillaripes]|nr:hypothetical protein B0H19DRAFT_1080879 [Mycena capillaripes]